MSQSVLELVAEARARAEPLRRRIADGDAAATVELEAIAVDVFTAFEARMQHHFRRGPFSRKLKAKLAEDGQGDLAERIYQYYLAVNVLKHGKGASYRELLGSPTSLVSLMPDAAPCEEGVTSGLIDVTASGFFERLTDAIVEAYRFLETA